jgi:hypothetical protein
VNNVSLNLSRDEVYTGSSVPKSEKGFSSYTHKLSTIFNPPGSSLEDATLSSKGDALAFNLSIPLVNRVGFNSYLSSVYSESNFISTNETRDTVVQNSLSLAVPFYLLGNEQIEILPQLEREIRGDYKSVNKGIKEGELLYNTGKFLFMPPFYYINPFKGLGRVKDYDAVDVYKDTSDILGNTTNTLSTGYRVDTYLQYERWYIPSAIGFSITGETKREGENYTQKRITGTWFDKYIYMTEDTTYYEKSINVYFDYENERDYTTKVLKNSFGIISGLNLLKEEWRGIKTGYSFTYTRERQKIGDKRLYLFPDSPEREIEVSEKPYKDKIESEMSFEYLWEYDLKKNNIFSRLGPGTYPVGLIQNTERIVLENIYTFTDREKAENFSNIPLRITAEHNSSYRMTDNVEFGMNLKTVVGVEEKIIPPSITGNVLPSMGLEIGIFARIIF